MNLTRLLSGSAIFGKARLVNKRGVEVTEEVNNSVRATLQKQLEEIVGKIILSDSDGKELPLIQTLLDTTTAIKKTLSVIRNKAGLLNSGVKAADAVIKTSPGDVYWMTISDTAALAVELNDSGDNTGTDLWALSLPAAGYAHFIFDPPLEFTDGIYLDVSTTTCKVIIGYV